MKAPQADAGEDLLAQLDAMLGADPRQDPAARRILLVEDDEEYRAVIKRLLEREAHEVIEAGDGVEGLSQAALHRPELVVTDFGMPRMNGYELLKELRSRPETRAVPVIVLTGAANRKELRETMVEAYAFLEKPLHNATFLEAVRRALCHAPVVAAPAGEPKGAAPPGKEADELELGGDGDDLRLNFTEEPGGKQEETSGLEVLANDTSLISQVNKILIRAVELSASDIHIEPQERETVVRVRVNGTLTRLCAMPASIHARLTARVKIMSNLVITERRLPQDGQIRAVIKGKKVEFRVSTLPGLHGEKVVLRVLGGGKIKASLQELGLTPRDLDCIEAALKTPHGMILVTGPTGSGKSTTLYTMLRLISLPDVNVLTIEDPVEYELPGITQVPVKAAIGLTFESALRAFLRQDPDVMLVGEIRDIETAEIAVKASITGHLVLSTLHTNSASATVSRLTHMGVPPYLLATSLKLIVAQRLVRVLCPACKVPVALSQEEQRSLDHAEFAALKEVYRGVGCRSCHQTGYAGRKPIFEVMPIRSPEMKARITEKGNPDRITEQAASEGMVALRQAALLAVTAGETSLPEAMKIMMGD